MTKNKRTIESILDLKTGQEIFASKFFEQPHPEIIKKRYEFETYIQERNYRYVCYYCKQPIKIRGQVDSKTIFHFAHTKDSDECFIKTGRKFSKAEIQCIKYNGAKESDLHIQLKNKIADFLKFNEQNDLGVKDVRVEKVVKHLKIAKTWKKPDVACVYNDKQIVFELQLSTTFLSVINSRQEFYKSNSSYILWVFHSFETDVEKRKLTQSDVFYNNNLNGFELNKEAINLSFTQKDLVLKCHYCIPLIKAGKIVNEYASEMVSLKNLTFKEDSYSVFYFDYEEEKKKVEKELAKINMSKRFKLIRNLCDNNISDIGNLINSGYQITEIEKEFIKILYDQEIENSNGFDRYNWKYGIVWLVVIMKLADIDMIKRFVLKTSLKNIVFDILSLKLNKFIGYAYTKQIQIAHRVFEGRIQYADFYLKAMSIYQPDLIEKEDKKDKLRKKIIEFKRNKPEQDYDDSDILYKIFKELKE